MVVTRARNLGPGAIMKSLNISQLHDDIQPMHVRPESAKKIQLPVYAIRHAHDGPMLFLSQCSLLAQFLVNATDIQCET